MSAATVRDATRADYDQLCAVVSAIDEFHVDLLPSRFRRFAGPARPRDWLTGLIDEPDGLLLVSEVGGQVVGFLAGRVMSSPDAPMHVPRRFLMVNGLGVLAAHRKQGVGRTLMERARGTGRAAAA